MSEYVFSSELFPLLTHFSIRYFSIFILTACHVCLLYGVFVLMAELLFFSLYYHLNKSSTTNGRNMLCRCICFIRKYKMYTTGKLAKSYFNLNCDLNLNIILSGTTFTFLLNFFSSASDKLL